MAKKKLEIMAADLNNKFRDQMPKAFKEKYGIDIITEFNFYSMRLVTYSKDGSDFTPEQLAFIDAYGEGYCSAMMFVQNAI